MDAKDDTPILKANYALVKAALQTVPEELAVEVQCKQHQRKRFSSSCYPPSRSLTWPGWDQCFADSGFFRLFAEKHTWFLQYLGYFAVNVEERWRSWE